VKRALMATVFGGLLIFAIPQAASGRTGSAHRVTAAEATAGETSPGCATAPAGADAKHDPPGEGKSHYDRQSHDDNNAF
jgi:hypothetical protein